MQNLNGLSKKRYGQYTENCGLWKTVHKKFVMIFVCITRKKKKKKKKV